MDRRYKYILRLLKKLLKEEGEGDSPGSWARNKPKKAKKGKKAKVPGEKKKYKIPSEGKTRRRGPRHDVPDGRVAGQRYKKWKKERRLLYLTNKLEKENKKLRDLRKKRDAYYKKFPLDPGKTSRLKEERRTKFQNLLTAAQITYHNDQKALSEYKTQLLKEFNKNEIRIAREYVKQGWSKGDIERLVINDLSKKKYSSFGHNLGFSIKEYIDRYGKDYQLGLAHEILREPETIKKAAKFAGMKRAEQLSEQDPITYPKEGIDFWAKAYESFMSTQIKTQFPKFMVQQAKDYILQHETYGSPDPDKYFYKMKYGREKLKSSSTVYQDLLELHKMATGGLKEHLKILIDRYEKKVHIYRWEYEYMKASASENIRAKAERLTESASFDWLLAQIKRDMPIYAFRAIDKQIRKLYAKHDDVDVAFAIGKGRVRASYEKLFNYITEHHDHLLFNPKLAQSLAESEAFFEAFTNWAVRHPTKVGKFRPNARVSFASELYDRITGMAKDNKIRQWDTSALEAVQNRKHELSKLKFRDPKSMFSRTQMQEQFKERIKSIIKTKKKKKKKK